MSIRVKLVLLFLSLGVFFSFWTHLYWLPKIQHFEKQNLQKNELAYVEALSTSLVPALLSYDLAQIHATLNSIRERKPNWESVKLTDSEQMLLYPFKQSEKLKPESDNILVLSHTIEHENEKLGTLQVSYNISAKLDYLQQNAVSVELNLLAILLSVTIAAAFLVDRIIIRPLKHVAEVADHIADGEFDVSTYSTSRDEIGQLSNTIDTMRYQLKARQRDLERHDHMLEIIRDSQTRFIQDISREQIFNAMLDDILAFTEANCGFIAEVSHAVEEPRIDVISIAEDREVYTLEQQDMELEFHAVVKTGKPLIFSRLLLDEEGQTAANNIYYLGMPFKQDSKTIGLFGIIRDSEEFDKKTLELLQPLSNTCTQIIEADRSKREKERMEAIIRERETRTRTILNGIADGVVTVNAKGVIKDFNAAAETIFGFTAEEIVGQDISVLVPAQYRKEHSKFLVYSRTEISEIFGKGREVCGARKNGQIFPVKLTVADLYANGENLFCAVVTDITESKRLSKMKNEFVSTVSHELRTPLTSILGSLSMIQSGKFGDIPEQTSGLITIALNNSKRLLALINDLLDMEKLAAGKMPMDFKDVQIDAFLEEAVSINQGFAENHNARFEITESSACMILADQQRLMQAVSNLMSNAAKFSPDGATVELSCTTNDDYIRISVTDHGPGIAEDFQDKIFERFTQSDSSDTRRVGGTGLGLSISKEIVEQHGGSLNFYSKPGHGTTFFIDLPLHKANIAVNE